MVTMHGIQILHAKCYICKEPGYFIAVNKQVKFNKISGHLNSTACKVYLTFFLEIKMIDLKGDILPFTCVCAIAALSSHRRSSLSLLWLLI